jgi:hypothetical protein
MLFLALSSLQGRPMRVAFDALAELEIDGIQLTPGNLPEPGFRPHAAASRLALRTHHGFDWDRRRRPVWEGARVLVEADSVHPPQALAFEEWLDALVDPPALEIMYPGQHLGCEAELSRAMERRLWLAVDVSHAYIQRVQGTLTEAGWRRLQDYDRIAEIHLSANDGKNDTHRPIEADTFGIEWARSRTSTPVILESYFHALSPCQRRRQIELARG